MKTDLSREDGIKLLKEYNKEEFKIWNKDGTNQKIIILKTSDTLQA